MPKPEDAPVLDHCYRGEATPEHLHAGLGLAALPEVVLLADGSPKWTGGRGASACRHEGIR